MEGVTDLEILRTVLARELETINEYTALARQAQDPAVRNLLLHIGRDEEEHVAECIQWISRLNPVMANFLSRPAEHVNEVAPVSREPARAPAVAPVVPIAAMATPVGLPAPAAPAVALTVGGPTAASPPPAAAIPSSPPATPAAGPASAVLAPLGGQLLSRAGLTVGNLLNRPVGRD